MTAAAPQPIGDRPTPPSRQMIAARFRGLLAEADISARALARQLGVAHTWVTDRRRGDVPISLEDVLRVAPYLGLTAEVMFAELIRQRDSVQGEPTASPVTQSATNVTGAPSACNAYSNVIPLRRSA